MYVSNLGFHTTEDDLRKLFEAFGQVSSAKIITDHETGKPRGFGFVEMPSSTEGSQAMEKLNGKELEGRAMSVSLAREKDSRQDKKRW